MDSPVANGLAVRFSVDAVLCLSAQTRRRGVYGLPCLAWCRAGDDISTRARLNGRIGNWNWATFEFKMMFLTFPMNNISIWIEIRTHITISLFV